MLLADFQELSPNKRRDTILCAQPITLDILVWTILHDADAKVRGNALCRSKHLPLSAEVLRRVFEHDKSRDVRFAVAEHANCPTDILQIIAVTDFHPMLRCLAILHKNCPLESIIEALNDVDLRVRLSARARI